MGCGFKGLKHQMCALLMRKEHNKSFIKAPDSQTRVRVCEETVYFTKRHVGKEWRRAKYALNKLPIKVISNYTSGNDLEYL